MILSGTEVQNQMQMGRIKIDPLPSSASFGPNSVDLHLGHELRVYRRHWIDRIRAWFRGEPWSIDPDLIRAGLDQATELVPVRKDGRWLLRPGRLYLGSTMEWTSTDGFVPYLDGRSSLARLGVQAHLAAGRGDDGFRGRWTVEMVATEPVLIRPGSRIFQITYHKVMGSRRPYEGRYQDSKGPRPSLLSRPDTARVGGST